jgi:hypothetical protein
VPQRHPAAAGRRAPAGGPPPFPAKALRFPSLPKSRRRGPSARHVIYLGTHPIALILSVCVQGIALMLYLSVIMMIVMVYAAYDVAVITAWLCRLIAWQVQASRR